MGLRWVLLKIFRFNFLRKRWNHKNRTLLRYNFCFRWMLIFSSSSQLFLSLWFVRACSMDFFALSNPTNFENISLVLKVFGIMLVNFIPVFILNSARQTLRKASKTLLLSNYKITTIERGFWTRFKLWKAACGFFYWFFVFLFLNFSQHFLPPNLRRASLLHSVISRAAISRNRFR